MYTEFFYITDGPSLMSKLYHGIVCGCAKRPDNSWDGWTNVLFVIGPYDWDAND